MARYTSVTIAISTITRPSTINQDHSNLHNFDKFQIKVLTYNYSETNPSVKPPSTRKRLQSPELSLVKPFGDYGITKRYDLAERVSFC